MPFRRRSKSTRKTLRASGAACEQLESRTLLTAVINGLFQGTNTIYDGTNTFIFRQANGDDNIKISVTGNITAEFIGAHAPMTANELDLVNEDGMVLTDLLPDTAAAFVAPAIGPVGIVPAQNVSTFLFSIYIVSASLNSAISIAQVANRANPLPPRPMQPFSAGQLMNVFNATTGAQVNITPDDGGVYIGAQTLAAQLIQQPQITPNPAITDLSTPLTWSNQRAFGMRPSSAGELFAGVETAAGVDIGKIFIGGTITGIVDIKGDIDTFYAGTVLTGDAGGISALGFESDFNPRNIGHFPTHNFHVEGDLRNLVTANSLGTVTLTDVSGTAGDFTSPTYKTGFQLEVLGRVGQVFANDSFLGQAMVRNLASVPGPGTIQKELEFFNTGTFTGDGTFFDPDFMGIDIAIGAATLDARFQNNTFDSAQWLGSSRSQQLNSANIIQLRGALGNVTPSGPGGGFDPIDFFALPLLAGQTVDIQLTDNLQNLPTAQHIRLGIIDPRGRVIATDYSNEDVLKNNGGFSRVNKTIRITAAIPGSYRIAIANNGDFNFNGTVDAGEAVTSVFPNTYELRITNPGDIAFGGLIVNQHIGTLDVDHKGIEVLRGDMGEIRAGLGATDGTRPVAPAQGQGQIFSASNVWYVPGGHFRAMEAFSIGVSGAVLVIGSGPDLLVRKGSIGLLHTTAATLTNTLVMNDDYFLSDGLTPLFPRATDDLSRTPAYLAAGQDIQIIDCAGVLEGDYLANRRIGTIRTQQLGGLLGTAPVIQVNVDTVGSDGVIDLISVTLNGTAILTPVISVFAPAISTGPNGNLRYFSVAQFATAIPDAFFGIPGQMLTTYDPGEQARITDDSGAQVVLTPIPRDPMTLFPLPTNRLSDFLDPPSLSVLTYPIRDKGGVAILRVSVSQVDDTGSDGVTNIVRPGGGGVMVESGSSGRSAEIGMIDLTPTPAAATSNPFTFNPFTGTNVGIPARSYQQNEPPVAPAQPIRPLNLIFKGSGAVDVYDIVTTAAQIINSIDNQTRGEIVNITGAPDIFSFSAQTIGIPRSTTPAQVEGAVVRLAAPAAGQPFLDARVLVNVGDVNFMSARGAVGNVQAVNIGTVQANSDGKNTSGTFEGIAGPVVARGIGNNLIGNVVLARVGEGVLPSGTGNLIKAGIYADAIIDTVTGNGDIRGDVVATGNTTRVTQQATDIDGNALINPDGTPLQVSTPEYNIGSIRLNGGSIIDADIMTTTFDQSIEGFFSGSGGVALELADSSSSPVFDIGSVRVDGTGGVIGSFIFAADVGQVAINGGFGFVNSTIITLAGGVAQGITTDGFGVRDALIGGVGSLRSVVARGKGARVATSSYSASVRQSETGAYDRYTGQSLDASNDLHQYLGTSSRRPAVVGNSETGLIVDSQFFGTGELGTVQAFRILGKDVIVIDPLTNLRVRIPFGSTAYPMRINFSNSANSIQVTDVVDGLSLTTGRLKSFSAGGDVSYTALNVGTSLESFYAGAFRGTSSLKMTTGVGTLQNFRTKRSLYGQVVVSQDILNMTVGTDIGSPLIRASRNIKNLKVTGSVLTGASISAGRTLSNLVIGKDLQQGATIRAKAITKQSIGGQVLGDIIIA